MKAHINTVPVKTLKARNTKKQSSFAKTQASRVAAGGKTAKLAKARDWLNKKGGKLGRMHIFESRIEQIQLSTADSRLKQLKEVQEKVNAIGAGNARRAKIAKRGLIGAGIIGAGVGTAAVVRAKKKKLRQTTGFTKENVHNRALADDWTDDERKQLREAANR